MVNLEKNPQKTIEDLQNDEYFKAIATQQVGEKATHGDMLDTIINNIAYKIRDGYVRGNFDKSDHNTLKELSDPSEKGIPHLKSEIIYIEHFTIINNKLVKDKIAKIK